METGCDVSVIIVNYRTSRLVADCINSIFSQTSGVSYEIIVVDNNSEADFESIIRNDITPPPFIPLTFISLPENIGFGRANNKALEFANGRNIFFLNPDTILLNNAIGILSRFLDEHAGAGACGGNLVGENLLPTLSFKRHLPGIFWEINELLNNIPFKIAYRENRIYNASGHPFEVAYITGADLMVKKMVLDETGSFSHDFFMYYEETDLCARIRHKGWKIYSVPQASIQHLEGKSFSGFPALNKDKILYLETSRIRYLNNNNSPLSTKICNMIYSCFLRSRVLFVKEKAKKEYYKERLKAYKVTK